MSDFSDSLADWDSFYGSVAGVSATLVGLLFVAVSINPRITNNRTRAGLNAWTGQTFQSFSAVLMLSLFAQIPDGAQLTLIIGSAIVGVQGLARLMFDIQRIRTGDKDPGWRGTAGVRRFAAPLIAYTLCLWVTWALVRDTYDIALGSLVAVILLLLVDALDNCWSLLKEIGKDED